MSNKIKLAQGGNIKILWVLTVIVIITIFIIAIYFIFFNKPSNIPDTPTNQICQQIPMNEVKNMCLTQVNNDLKFAQDLTNEDKLTATALINSDISFCKQITQDEPKNICLNDLAQKSGNIEICSSAENREMCYFNYVVNLFWEEKSKDIKITDCLKFSQTQPEYQTCLAFMNNDVGKCNQDNPSCISLFKQDLSFCDQSNFDTQDKNECLRNRALSSKDVSVCQKITNEMQKNDCYLDYAGHIEANATICNNISDPMIKSSCLLNVAVKLK